MSKAIEIVADASLDYLHGVYAMSTKDIMAAAVAGNPKVMSDLQRLIGSLDHDTLAKIISDFS